MSGDDKHGQCGNVADEVHAAGDTAGFHQINRVHQHAADGPECTRPRACHAIIKPQAEALRQLPFLFDRCVVVDRGFRCATKQQVQSAAKDNHRQHFIEPFGGHVMGDNRTNQCACKGPENRQLPLSWVEQFASVKRQAGSGGTER